MAVAYLSRILLLGEEEWLLADKIARANAALVLGRASGQDVGEPQAELQSVVALFHEGKYVLSRQGLSRIYAMWPQFFAAPEPTLVGFLCGLCAFSVYLGKCRMAQNGPAGCVGA
jgi:hypothetical protein